jgi:ketosteroid isomerase-like protein
MTYSLNIQAAIDILQDEANGDVASALAKMAKDYRMTWMYKAKDELFPKTGDDVHSELNDVYPIQGRQYDIRNITEGEGVVMIEMIESYPDPETGKVYRTPQVIVLEFKDGLIRTGRHYTDPDLSYMQLPAEQIDSALRDTKAKIFIENNRKHD